MQTSNTKDQNELIFALNHLFFVLRKTTPFSKNSKCHSLWFLLQIEKSKRKGHPSRHQTRWRSLHTQSKYAQTTLFYFNNEFNSSCRRIQSGFSASKS